MIRTTTIVIALLTLCSHSFAFAQEEGDDDLAKRRIAVAMNMCRASFHRIRSEPSKRVLIEEQEEILNNLNLSWIEDEEVVRLYTSVLDEVGQVQIAEQEREFFRKRFRQEFLRNVGFNAFVLSTQVATFNYPGAVRTGATTFWDYRFTKHQRDLDVWKVEKQRMMSVVDKSSQMLDTFWKLTKKRDIPDRWLVRSNDLDNLTVAMNEPDPEVRLRVLKRMERFHECYPPYWYYMGRTQQELGQLFAASETYKRLADLVSGHFRKDDMLAGALANRAAIQAYLHQPEAAETALMAIRASSDVWQVNLTCAQVLYQYRKYDKAEDAILRNVDVDLEKQHSLTALVSLYAHSRKQVELIKLLDDETVVQTVPVPILLQAVSTLEPRQIPRPVVTFIARSLYAVPQVRFGVDDLRFVAANSWHLDQAQIALKMSDHGFEKPTTQAENGVMAVRFPGVLNISNPFQPIPADFNVKLDVQYAGIPPIRVYVEQDAPSRERVASGGKDSGNAGLAPLSVPGYALKITKIDVGETRLTWLRDTEGIANSTITEAPVGTSTATKPEVEARPSDDEDEAETLPPKPPTEKNAATDDDSGESTIPIPDDVPVEKLSSGDTRPMTN